jgi:hypothetical protein
MQEPEAGSLARSAGFILQVDRVPVRVRLLKDPPRSHILQHECRAPMPV